MIRQRIDATFLRLLDPRTGGGLAEAQAYLTRCNADGERLALLGTNLAVFERVEPPPAENPTGTPRPLLEGQKPDGLPPTPKQLQAERDRLTHVLRLILGILDDSTTPPPRGPELRIRELVVEALSPDKATPPTLNT